jgi:hypothetical protein
VEIAGAKRCTHDCYFLSVYRVVGAGLAPALVPQPFADLHWGYKRDEGRGKPGPYNPGRFFALIEEYLSEEGKRIASTYHEAITLRTGHVILMHGITAESTTGVSEDSE